MRAIRLFHNQWAFFFIALLLFGCGKPEVPPTPARRVLFSDEFDLAKEFLGELQGFGAYGYLLFTKRPQNEELNRFIAVCKAFTNNLEPVANYPEDAWPSIMPTYWLIKGTLEIDEESPDCQRWIEFYDYARAKTMASAVKVLSSEGPILVAWKQPFGEGNYNENALVLDLSDFSNDDLDRAFRIWMDRITREPEIWRAGLNLVLVREAFRNFLEKYGDNVIKAVQTIKEVIG